MTLQLAVVLTLLAAAVAYILQATWKTWFGSASGCGSACGKCVSTPVEPPVKGRIALPTLSDRS